MKRLIQLSRSQWVIVGAFIGVVFPVLLLLVYMPVVGNWLVVATTAPHLERDLGFHAAVAVHPGFPGRETFHIVSVVPGGVFDRAGIRSGDVPLHIHHGSGDFYGLLRDHRGRQVEVRVLRISSGPTDSFPVEQSCNVLVPRAAG
jgi:hypothetical protein